MGNITGIGEKVTNYLPSRPAKELLRKVGELTDTPGSNQSHLSDVGGTSDLEWGMGGQDPKLRGIQEESADNHQYTRDLTRNHMFEINYLKK